MKDSAFIANEDLPSRFRRLLNSVDPARSAREDLPGRLSPSQLSDPQGVSDPGQEKSRFWASITLASGRRMMVGFVTMIVIIFLTYLGLRMAQGTEFGEAAKRAAAQTPRYVQMLLKGSLGMTGEYGYSRRPFPIQEILPEIFIRSFGLLTAALLIAALLGVPLGLWAGTRRRKFWSLPAIIFSILGISAPSFFIALLLQLLVIQLTRAVGDTVLPVGGFGWDEHLILPALVLAARPFAQITRVSYVTFSKIMDEEYIRTARSKGLFPLWIITQHIFPNALIPILTTLAVAIRFSLISLPIVEYFFGWQGVGFYLLKAISTQEYEFAIAMLLSLSLAFIFANAVLEVSYRFIDPRLREAQEENALIEFEGVFEMLKRIPRSIDSFLAGMPLIGRIWRGDPKEPLPSLKAVMDEVRQDRDPEQTVHRPAGRIWIRGTLYNPAFMVGAILFIGLVIVVVFGIQIAPQNPYTTRGLTISEGEFLVPPFPPDDKFLLGTDLLGRDILSLILAGAQQTFVLVSLVVLGRILVGFILGAVSGWLNGGWVDRILMGWVEVLASFPALLLAMVLILALDIRRGLFPFFLALTFVGWGEIMQFVRAEVMRLKSLTFIESAIASGATIPRILGKHIQPNLIPALISLTALEMGAVLMILGELGFVGIFIGGGIFAELEWMAPLFHYSDVPEWGALLGNLRTYARGYPWMGIYPGAAFFLAILAFNLFGEGLRTLIDRVGVRATRWLNKYSLAGIVFLIVVTLGIKGSTGATASYRKEAEKFMGTNVTASIAALTSPSAEGRELGSMGIQVAAAWIADQYADLGLQPAGEGFTFFQSRDRAYELLEAAPVLAFDIDMPELTYKEDFNVFPSENTISGRVYAPVTFLALGEVRTYERLGYRYYELEGFDYSAEILLVFPEDMFYVDQISHAGALVIAPDKFTLQRQYTLSPYGAFGREAPSFWIDKDVANRLLGTRGFAVDQLYDIFKDLGEQEHVEIRLDVHAALELDGEVVKDQPVQNVIGHWQGFVSNEFEGIDDELYIILAKYDCPPVDLKKEPLPCANDNSSGVGVMLETVRAMRAAGYQPYRTFLFIAYSGEGYEGGGQFQLDIDKFLEAKHGFDRVYDLQGVIELRGLGSGVGKELTVTSEGSQRLAALFIKAAGQQGLHVESIGEDLDLRRIFESGSAIESGSEVPWITISRAGWDQRSHTRLDRAESIEQDYLQSVGRAFTQTLMVLGRELNY